MLRFLAGKLLGKPRGNFPERAALLRSDGPGGDGGDGSDGGIGAGDYIGNTNTRRGNPDLWGGSYIIRDADGGVTLLKNTNFWLVSICAGC